MTQEKRNTFLTSVPVPMLTMNSEYDEQSEDKNDSELCNIALSEQAEIIVKELNSMHGQAKKKIEELIQQLRQDKLKDHEIKEVLFSRVNFVSRRTLYNALPQEFKREYTKPLPKTINISTPHKVIEPVEEYIGSPEPKEEEGPSPLELAEIKIKQLEDALKKTEQFKPANKLTEAQARDMTMEAVKQAGMAVPQLNEEGIFEWLGKRDDKVSRYWYPNYGIELFRTRILSDLNNRGVKMFKRLYFEI